jgi:hypothetical protein
VTTPEGRFTLEDLQQGRWRLKIGKEGFADRTVAVEVGAGDVEVPPISLDRTPGLVLVVHLADGTVPQVVTAMAYGAGPEPVWTGAAQTGLGGRTVLASLPAGSWDLTVSGPGTGPARVPVTVPGDPVPVVLQPACRLRVRVPELAADGSAGATGSGTLSALVRLNDAQGRPPWFFHGREPAFPMAGDTAEVPALPAGAWTVTVTAPDGRTWSGTAVTRPGETAELVLQ